MTSRDRVFSDFDISVLEQGSQFVLRGACWLGEASSDPLSARDLEPVASTTHRRNLTDAVSPDRVSIDYQRAGQLLYERTFTGGLRGLFCSAVSAVGKAGGLRVTLNLQGRSFLQSVPWELIWSSDHNRHLGLSQQTTLIRRLDAFEKVAPLSTTFPLKILVCIASPVDMAPLDSASEIESIEQQLRTRLPAHALNFTVCRDASLNEIQELLLGEEYHVVHFSGHGGLNVTSKLAYLAFSGRQRKTREVSAQQFAILLQPYDSIRLVVLNACNSADPGRQTIDGIAQALVAQGVPAVVAMQREITDSGAISFATAFYAAIANCHPVDESMALARRELFLGDTAPLEWPIASLYTRSKETRLFDLPSLERRRSARVDARDSAPLQKLSDALACALVTVSTRYVTEATAELSALSAAGHASGSVLEGLAVVLDVVGTYVAAHANLTLGDMAKVPVSKPATDDAWTAIAGACRCMNFQDYRAALLTLEACGDGVARYLRALCHFRMGRATIRSSDRLSSFARALEEFRSILDQAADLESERDRLLRMHSFCWFAIISFYMEDFAVAESSFTKGLQLARGPERARCFNGLAFVHLATGDFGRSDSTLLLALESDAGYPIARSNFGYALLTRGDFDAAEAVFGALVADPELRESSPKDVVLARLALVHLAECRGEEAVLIYQLYVNIVADVFRAYAIPLAFSNLALAQIRLRVAERIYLNERFNGLEVFALALLARAYLDLTASPADDEATRACIDQIATCIQEADCPIGWRFYNSSYGGWFRSIVEYRNNLESRPAAA